MNFILQIIERYFKSFDNTEHGYSRKKLLGTFLILSGVTMQFIYIALSKDYSMIGAFATLDFSTALMVLGINTYQSIKTNNPNNSNQNEEQK